MLGSGPEKDGIAVQAESGSGNCLLSDTEKEALAAAVRKILASPVFEKTHRLSALLQYLCDQTVTGDVAALKEPVIGQRMFGRPPNYSAADDNIVRSNIRQLRLKLSEYYDSAGVEDPWRISVPKGSYGMRIEPQSAKAAVHRSSVVAIELGAHVEAAPRLERTPWKLPGASYFLPLVLLLVAAGGLLYRYSAAERMASNCILGLLAPAPGQRLLIVGPDANLQLFRRLTGRTVPLREYLNRQYLKSDALREVLPGDASVRERIFSASITEAFLLNLIPSFARVVPSGALSLPAPDSLNVKDFRRDNALLISGPLGNPWVQLFDRSLNFQIESENHTFSYIVNRKPVGAEPASYHNFHSSAEPANPTVCYARLAYLPGLTPGARVVLAGGPSAESTQATSQFLTRPDLFDALRRKLGKRPEDPLPWFEAVVETRALGGEPWTARISAIRIFEGRSSELIP